MEIKVNLFTLPKRVIPVTRVEVTSTPTRPVDNVVIATKGLQDRNTNIIAGTTVENKGKLILPELGYQMESLRSDISSSVFLCFQCQPFAYVRPLVPVLPRLEARV